MIERPTPYAANDGAPGTVQLPNAEGLRQALDYSTDKKWADEMRKVYGLDQPEKPLLARAVISGVKWLIFGSIALGVFLMSYALGHI